MFLFHKLVNIFPSKSDTMEKFPIQEELGHDITPDETFLKTRHYLSRRAKIKLSDEIVRNFELIETRWAKIEKRNKALSIQLGLSLFTNFLIIFWYSVWKSGKSMT